MGLPLVPVQVVHERLIKTVASAGVSSDALSLTADATEELLLGHVWDRCCWRIRSPVLIA
jgi:hypothetical protein